MKAKVTGKWPQRVNKLDIDVNAFTLMVTFERIFFWNDLPIPHICHFFYTDRIFENQILHPKKRLKAPKTLKMSLKKSNICSFSLNLYTWQKIFTQTCLWCLWQIKGMTTTWKQVCRNPDNIHIWNHDCVRIPYVLVPKNFPAENF